MNSSYPQPSMIISDSVYQILAGCVYGGIWGMVTPFHPPGSKGAMIEAKTGIFKAAKPFSSISSIGHNAAMFGTIMGVQKFSSRTIQSIRQQKDAWNDLCGFIVTFQYYKYFLGASDNRLIMHNRMFGGTFLLTVLYGHMID